MILQNAFPFASYFQILLNLSYLLKGYCLPHPPDQQKSTIASKATDAALFYNPISSRQDVDELDERANAAEKELSRLVVGCGDVIRQVKLQKVKSGLKKPDSDIECVHYTLNFDC